MTSVTSNILGKRGSVHLKARFETIGTKFVSDQEGFSRVMVISNTTYKKAFTNALFNASVKHNNKFNLSTGSNNNRDYSYTIIYEYIVYQEDNLTVRRNKNTTRNRVYKNDKYIKSYYEKKPDAMELLNYEVELREKNAKRIAKEKYIAKEDIDIMFKDYDRARKKKNNRIYLS